MEVAYEWSTCRFIKSIWKRAGLEWLRSGLFVWLPRNHCRLHVRMLSQLSRTCPCTALSACREIHVQLLPACR